MQDEYRQIFEEEDKGCCCGGHDAFHKMRDNAMNAAKGAKAKYDAMEAKEKKQLWTVIAGAAALLFGLITLSKIKGKKKSE